MTVANAITFIRIFVSPIFLLIYLKHESLGISYTALPYILLFLLAVSELSDAFDGYIARRMNQVTDLGKILDPMADSIYRTSVFLTFTTGIIQLPMLLVFVFIYRDSVITTLRSVCALRGFALAARTSGKLKAIIQALAAFAVLLSMIPHSLGLIETATFRTIAIGSVGFAAFYAAASGIEYLYAYREIVVKIFTQKPSQVTQNAPAEAL